MCGTAGLGVTHLLNGLLDAKHERSRGITVANDVETELIDTEAIEKISPYDLFRTASLYTGRVVNRKQAPQVFAQAINTCVAESSPTVIALPGDIASQDAEDIPILGGDGCRHSADDVIALAQKLDAPWATATRASSGSSPITPMPWA